MLRLFKRAKKKVEIPRDPPPGMYQGVWEKKRQPSPGAQAYAWESVGLAQFTPIGPSVHVRQGINVLPGAQQPYVGQGVWLDGVPTTAGQVFGQQLYDPNSGYTSGLPPTFNSPFPYSSEPMGGSIL